MIRFGLSQTKWTREHLELTGPPLCFLPVITVLPRGCLSHLWAEQEIWKTFKMTHQDLLPRNLSEVDCHLGNCLGLGHVPAMKYLPHKQRIQYHTCRGGGRELRAAVQSRAVLTSWESLAKQLNLPKTVSSNTKWGLYHSPHEITVTTEPTPYFPVHDWQEK